MTCTIIHQRNDAFSDRFLPVTGTVSLNLIFDNQITKNDRPISALNIASSLEIHDQAMVVHSKFDVTTLNSRRRRQQIPIDKPAYLPRASTPAVSSLEPYPTPAE